ncbi:MAG TPA: universal stress protein [Solirubrobacterales bacterium]|nr:universal stress protein [Solirubrobacterales bacterium]
MEYEPLRTIAVAYDDTAAAKAALARAEELALACRAAIVEACEEAGADLLVAGSRNYGPVRRVLLGSVSTQLMHRAPCPVLVVPRP